MFKVLITSFKPNSPERYHHEIRKSFKTREEAFQYADTLARKEVDQLNNATLVDGVSFGIPEGYDEYQDSKKIRVEYYYDDNTEQVTHYVIYEKIKWRKEKKGLRRILNRYFRTKANENLLSESVKFKFYMWFVKLTDEI